jgi:hypothetical protein
MLVKHNNNSISDITTAGQLAQGKMTLISSQTASGSASIEFTSGIDSTYPIYKFEFINCHPANDAVDFTMNLSTDGGSSYNVAKTTTYFLAFHFESGGASGLSYRTGSDLAQGTGFQTIAHSQSNDNDASWCGEMKLFNPSSTTFVKHFISRVQHTGSTAGSYQRFMAGYGNTTNSVDAVRFQMSSGNIDSGTIKLYGIGD